MARPRCNKLSIWSTAGFVRRVVSCAHSHFVLFLRSCPCISQYGLLPRKHCPGFKVLRSLMPAILLRTGPAQSFSRALGHLRWHAWLGRVLIFCFQSWAVSRAECWLSTSRARAWRLSAATPSASAGVPPQCGWLRCPLGQLARPQTFKPCSASPF